MKKRSLNGPKFGFWLVMGITCICLGFLIATKFLKSITINPASLDLPLENERWVSFYDQQQKKIHKVFVREQIKIRISQMPTLLQKAFVLKKNNNFYSQIRSLNGLPPIFVAEFKKFIGLSDLAYYERDIPATLAHNIFKIRKKSLPLRLDEEILAYKIERKYRREEILEAYLNNIYFGEGVFGVEAASRYYFGKNTIKLQAHEIAFLITLATDTLSPDIYQNERLLQNPKVAKTKRDYILDDMAGGNIISFKQAREFKRKNLGVVSFK